MTPFHDDFTRHLERQLDRLRAEDRHRQLVEPQGIDFSSNDYLGLSAHPDLSRRVAARLTGPGGGAVGAPGSRLLRGHTRLHKKLEERLARFKGTERALIFPSGYQANLALLTSIIGPDDRVLSDSLNHASIIDALRLSGVRKKVVFPHLDLAAIEAAAAAPHDGGRTFLVTESLYSMDGDIAPLDAYAEVAARYDMGLVVDDTHATGCWGERRGSGLVEEFGVESRVLAITSTFGKALGLCGACVNGSKVLIECLVNRARPFIFTTATAPLLLHAIDVVLDLLAEEPERRRRLHHLARRFRDGLRGGGVDISRSESPIVPIVLGEDRRALEAAQALRRAGFDVRALRPPTVPEGTSRLRISVHADRTEDEVDRLSTAVVEAAGALP